MQVETQNFSGLEPRVSHVVGIAYPGHCFARYGPLMLYKGEDIGQDLARVEFVGQAIDDGYPRMRCKAFDACLLEGADHDQVDHARYDARRVFDRLGAAQLRVASGKMYD